MRQSSILILKSHNSFDLRIETSIEMVWNFDLHVFTHSLSHHIDEHFGWFFSTVVSWVLCIDWVMEWFRVVKDLFGRRMRLGVTRVEWGVYWHSLLEQIVCRYTTLLWKQFWCKRWLISCFFYSGNLPILVDNHRISIRKEVIGPISAQRVLNESLIA